VGNDAWGMARSTSSPVETDGWTASDETETQAHSVGSAECNEAPMNRRGNRARPRAVRATRAPRCRAGTHRCVLVVRPLPSRYPVQSSAAEGP